MREKLSLKQVIAWFDYHINVKGVNTIFSRVCFLTFVSFEFFQTVNLHEILSYLVLLSGHFQIALAHQGSSCGLVCFYHVYLVVYPFTLLQGNLCQNTCICTPACLCQRMGKKFRTLDLNTTELKQRFKRSFSVRFQLEYVPIAHTTKLGIQLNSPSWFSKHATMRRHGHIRGPNRMSGQKIYPDRGTDRRIASTKSTCLHSPIRIFLSRLPRALCSDRADKSSVRPPVRRESRFAYFKRVLC